MIARVARGLVRRTPFGALLAEDVVPYGVRCFERRTWVIKETEFDVRIWCSLDERAISRPILLDVYELAETRFIASTVKPGLAILDCAGLRPPTA